jgi:hypothetical protein
VIELVELAVAPEPVAAGEAGEASLA